MQLPRLVQHWMKSYKSLIIGTCSLSNMRSISKRRYVFGFCCLHTFVIEHFSFMMNLGWVYISSPCFFCCQDLQPLKWYIRLQVGRKWEGSQWELLLIWHCIAVKAFISLPKRTWSSKQAVIITLEVVMGVRLGPERTSRWMKSQEWNKRLQSKREHTKRQCLQHRRGFLLSFNS